jgi:hypothetical protein
VLAKSAHLSAPPQPLVEFRVIWYSYLYKLSNSATAFVCHDTKCATKYTKKISYGSQRPVVSFIVARGQYAPNGQGSMQVRPRGQKKPSQHGWQLVFLSGIVSSPLLLLGTGFEPAEQPHPGSQPGAQEDRPQFMFVLRKRFLSPLESYRLVK